MASTPGLRYLDSHYCTNVLVFNTLPLCALLAHMIPALARIHLYALIIIIRIDENDIAPI